MPTLKVRKSANVLNGNVLKRVAALLLLVGLIGFQVSTASAATLTTASVTLSDPRPNATSVTYDFLASNVTTSAIKCIRVEFDSAADGSGGKPGSLDITNAALNNGATDYVPTPASWTVNNNNTTGVSEITYATGETPASASGRNVVLTTITNGNTANDDYFLIVSTYNNTNCSSSPVDNVTIGFIYTDGQAASVTVNGSLTFSVAGVTGNGALAVNGATISNGLATNSTTIPFGTVTTGANRVAAQDLTVSTNSTGGYTVYTRYTQAPTSSGNTITAHAGNNGTPTTFPTAGTLEAFGYTTEDGSLSGTGDRFTSSGGNKWAAFSSSTNEELIYHNAPVSNQTTRVGFQVGIDGVTEPGTYTTTVLYTAVPVY